MKSTSSMKRLLAALLVSVMVLTLMPIHAHAAESGNESNTIFFTTDLHGECFFHEVERCGNKA